MSSEVENARAEGSGAGREGSVQDSERRTHSGNDVAASKAATPSIHDLHTYVDAGLQLIPLHRWDAKDSKGRTRGKSPRHGEWNSRDYDSRQVIEEAKRNGTNVGVKLDSGWVVLDVDPRLFPEGRDPFAEFKLALGLDLSTAPHTMTGGGGHHYWFRKPSDVRVTDSLKDYPGLEFKSAGRQVVAAGSVHPNGKMYELDDFAPPVASAPPAPLALIEAIRRPEYKAAGPDAQEPGELTPSKLAETLEQLDPENFREHDEWLYLMMACHHATAGDGREEFIEWSTGDPEYIHDADVIGRRWDSLHTGSRVDQPITIKYLHKVLQEHGGHVARTDPEDDFEPYEAGAEQQKPPRWRFISLEELESLPPPVWLVEGLFTVGGIGAIYGPPESFKSFLALDVALSIAANLPWNGREVSGGGVLYIAGEGAQGLGKRARAWRQRRGVEATKLPFQLMRDEINLASENVGDVRAFIDAVVRQIGPLKLIVIDTLNQTAAGADENAAKDMSRYITSMKRLRDATGAAVVVVHHSGKNPALGMRGSTAILGALDTAVEVERKPADGTSIEVAVKKQKDAERGPPMRFNLEKVGDSLVLHATMSADAAADFGGKDNPLLDLAADMALTQGGWFPMKELVDALIEQDGGSSSKARRKIDGIIPVGREAAVQASDGTRVWREQPGANPNGQYFVHAEIQEL